MTEGPRKRKGTQQPGRRKVLEAAMGIVAAAATRVIAGSTLPGMPRRAAICLPPSSAPDPVGPTKAWYAAEFAKHGLVDGRDIEIEIIRADEEALRRNEAEGVRAMIRRAVSAKAGVILIHASGPAIRDYVLPVAGDAPVVAFGVDDGSEDSIEALNRGGKNVTGAMYSFIELVAKRFEIMKELRPAARRAALVFPSLGAALTERQQAVKRWQQGRIAAAVKGLGIEVTFIDVPLRASPEDVVRTLREARIDLAEIGSFLTTGRELWTMIAKDGIAASGVGPGRAKAGALVSGWSEGYVEAAVRQAARVLRGERAATIPVERPSTFGLAVNLGTARTLGITVPPSILVRASEIFE